MPIGLDVARRHEEARGTHQLRYVGATAEEVHGPIYAELGGEPFEGWPQWTVACDVHPPTQRGQPGRGERLECEVGVLLRLEPLDDQHDLIPLPRPSGPGSLDSTPERITVLSPSMWSAT